MSRSTRTVKRLNFLIAVIAASLSLTFGFFKLANLLNITFNYQYSAQTINITIFSSTIDWAIWILSTLIVAFEIPIIKIEKDIKLPTWVITPALVLVVSVVAYLVSQPAAYLLAVLSGLSITALSIYFCDGYLLSSRKEVAEIVLSCFAGILVFFEIGSAVCWIINIFDYQVPFFTGPRWILPQIDLQLFNVFYPLTTALLLLFLYSWIWIPLLKSALHKIEPLKRLSSHLKEKMISRFSDLDPPKRLKRTHLALCLLITIGVSLFIAYYPNFHLQPGVLAGADSADYYGWLQGLTVNGTASALQTDRPIPLLAMYGLQHAIGASTETTVRIAPMIFTALPTLALFWFVQQGTKNQRLALLAAALSSMSFQTTIGVYGYFASNMLAIAESLVMLTCLLKAFEKKSWPWAAASTLLGFTVLLSHPYTWDVIMIILTLLLGWLMLRKKPGENSEIISVSFLLGSNLLFYVGYSLAPFGKQVGSGAGLASGALSTVSFSNFLNLPNNLSVTVQTWLAGLFSNPLLILLALVGVISMFQLAKTFNKITLLWIIVPSLAILAVSPDPYQYRFLYIIPFQIQAASGLQWIINRFEQTNPEPKHEWTRRTGPILIAMLVLLFLVNYAMRSVDISPLHFL
jgi:hypothetical protein